MTSCCGEHYCHSCISTDLNQHRPCPECGANSFNVVELVKLQRRVANLSAYCSMKERGCKWSGTLEELDAHINPHLNNCQYIDASCPLNCQQAVPRYELDDHVTKKCIKRNYSCQFCSFNATYQEIVDIHLPKCSYIPLQCPNMCGVSCECKMMDDHIKTCRLERVACQFSAMGCHEEFKRENQEAHISENAQTHLLLTATTLSQILNQECIMQQELEDQQRNTKTEFRQLSQMVAKQAHQLQDYKKKLEEGERKHEQELATYKKKLNDQDHKYKSKFEEYEVKFKCQDEKLKELEKFINLSRANGGGQSDGRIGGGATSGGGPVDSAGAIRGRSNSLFWVEKDYPHWLDELKRVDKDYSK